MTPFVDDELGAADRAAVDQHLQTCVSCRQRVACERAVRNLVGARRATLAGVRAPAVLRARVTRTAVPVPAPLPAWRARLAPLAMAAALVLIVGAAFVYQATGMSTRLMAAELAADHVKCFMMNAVFGTAHSPDEVEQAMAASFAWPVELPGRPETAGLELVGSRPCVYGQGRIAHLMYRHNGQPVSVFMLPDTQTREQYVAVLGHEAAVWSEGARTFVLVAAAPRNDVRRLVSFVQASLR